MPPPKPGVIPLAPLGLGDVLGGAFSTMGRYWKQLFGMAAALYGGAALADGGGGWPSPTPPSPTTWNGSSRSTTARRPRPRTSFRS